MPLTRRRLLGSTLASLVLVPLRAAGRETAGLRRLEARKAVLRLVPAPAAETPVWGFDGQVPGPLLRYKKGEPIKLRFVNSLEQPLTLSFQGLRYDNAFDGVAGLTQKPVLPGESFDYAFTPLDSGFYWYRSHVLAHIPEQLGRGLYGPLIIEEANPPEVDRELVLVLEDWKLDDEGAIVGDFGSPADTLGNGRIGALVTANSTPVPLVEKMPPGSRLRLRIVSAVNARMMFIGFASSLRPMVLAVDGQPCEAFAPVRNVLPIGPGARYDIMVDLPEENGAEANLILHSFHEPERTLLTLRSDGTVQKARPPIASLEANPLLPKAIRLENARRVDMVIEGGDAPAPAGVGPQKTASKSAAAGKSEARAENNHSWTLNGHALKEFGAKPAFSVKRGTPVTLTFVNKTGFLQHMHVHGHCFRLLHDLDDGWDPYWRDSVIIPEGRTKHIAFVADNPGKWVIESSVAERQAAGLLTWFEVT